LKLIWTNEALNRLSDIDNFIAQDSITRARKFVRELICRVSSIPLYPKKGRVVPEFDSRDIREMIFKNYRIVYRIKGDQIQILTVFEAHRLIRTNEVLQK